MRPPEAAIRSRQSSRSLTVTAIWFVPTFLSCSTREGGGDDGATGVKGARTSRVMVPSCNTAPVISSSSFLKRLVSVKPNSVVYQRTDRSKVSDADADVLKIAFPGLHGKYVLRQIEGESILTDWVR